MFTKKEYDNLKKKYGPYASWAIWDFKNEKDTSVIGSNLKKLNSRYVFLGLNISKPLNGDWSNFRGGSHDRKLKYACNNTKLRGSYLTDIFKGIVESKSVKLKKLPQEIIQANVSHFNKEMKDVGINNKTIFIILGGLASEYFNNYFIGKRKNNVINYHHYSAHGFKDKDWVEGLWKKLGIKADYNQILKKYKG